MNRAHEKKVEREQHIWMLFASGNNGRVTVNGYPSPAGSGKPVDAYLVADVDGDCKVAATRASISVWQYLATQGRQPGPQVLGFDISEMAAGSPVVGSSGGLAFALAAYCHFTGENIGFVAATGIIHVAGNRAKVTGVKGIGNKLEGALSVLPAGGQLFYPSENDVEIDEQLRQRFIAHDIALIPVVDISELLSSLEKGKKKVPEKKISVSLITAILFFCLLTTVGYVYFSDSEISVSVPRQTQLVPEADSEQNGESLVTEEPSGGMKSGGDEETFPSPDERKMSGLQENNSVSEQENNDTDSHGVNRDIVPQKLFLPENELTKGFE